MRNDIAGRGVARLRKKLFWLFYERWLHIGKDWKWGFVYLAIGIIGISLNLAGVGIKIPIPESCSPMIPTSNVSGIDVYEDLLR